MCGIAGIVAFTSTGKSRLASIENGTECLSKRGPDHQGIYKDDDVALGHRRLSIIDTSEAGHQPMSDRTGRYTIIFNGEIFNFREHIDYVRQHGHELRSHSDTEVLLHLYIIDGEKCLQKLNGFFAFAIYDKIERTVFIARDRMGIKPLHFFADENVFIFGSEMKALLHMGVPKQIDTSSLFAYLQLNYVPGNWSIFKNVKKVPPGNFCTISLKDRSVTFGSFYELRHPRTSDEESLRIGELNYEEQINRLRQLLYASVKRRMISDVPLGSFLSGGIDSSVISAIAATYTNKLKTFSIGFADEPMYDETEYADLVAKKIGSDHTVFKLKNDDLFNNLFSTLDYIDEPFADSSALNVFILSKETRKHVTVALSGDGADELFAGYNKHEAELRVRSGGMGLKALSMIGPFLKALPQSRADSFGNMIRKANRLNAGLKLSPADRYWRWASFTDERNAADLFKGDIHEYYQRKTELTYGITGGEDISDVLYTDLKLVLVNDMLTKVDLMSMANSLEVRVPFLDYTVVDFVTRLPIETKIDKERRKKILRDAFITELPPEVFRRGKKGFEVPLLKWFRKELYSLIHDDLLSENTINQQGLFEYSEIKKLKTQLLSSSPGDSPARIWGLLVFQYWYRKNIGS